MVSLLHTNILNHFLFLSHWFVWRGGATMCSICWNKIYWRTKCCQQIKWCLLQAIQLLMLINMNWIIWNKVHRFLCFKTKPNQKEFKRTQTSRFFFFFCPIHISKKTYSYSSHTVIFVPLKCCRVWSVIGIFLTPQESSVLLMSCQMRLENNFLYMCD